jgi:hypothetical protein
MRSKFLMRVLAIGASAAAVVGGGIALASDSAASTSSTGTKFYA